MTIDPKKIKPCPFCGSEPVIELFDIMLGKEDPEKIRTVWKIGCSGECFAYIGSTKWHHYSIEFDRKENMMDYIPPHMIDMWNQRA